MMKTQAHQIKEIKVDEDAQAYLFDSMQALSDSNTKEQFALLKKAAELKSSEARMTLVDIHLDKAREEYDPATAIDYLNREVINENPAAMMRMSRYHFHGFVVEQDNIKATEYMTDAALLGHDGARTMLAERYRHGLSLPNGETTEPDPVLAVLLLSLSAESGNHLSRIKLGDMYANGEGVNQNHHQAALHYKIAQPHSTIAEEKLHELYADGKADIKQVEPERFKFPEPKDNSPRMG
jgi:TPR repeat protein